jgi:hypothetical protein
MSGLQVSGKALAAGFSAHPEPVANVIPLSFLFVDPSPSEDANQQ